MFVEPSGRRRRSQAAAMLGLSAAVALGGCARTESESRQVIAAVVAELGTQPGSVCVDSRTSGPPLTIFRAMQGNDERRALRWRAPAPLPASEKLSNRQLAQAQLTGSDLRLPPPPQTGQLLPIAEQGVLNAVANSLSYAEDAGVTSIPADTAQKNVRFRWSIANWRSPVCDQSYSISNPIMRDGIALVRVSAGHWGTIYASRKTPTGWRVTAEWTRWLQ